MSYDCEIPEFYSEDFPKAAKVHRCCECSAPIEVGEKHLYARAKADGYFYVNRQHMLCRDLCMLLSRHSDEGCIPFEGMEEEWREGEWGYFWGDKRNLTPRPIRQARLLMARIIKRERAAQRRAKVAA